MLTAVGSVTARRLPVLVCGPKRPPLTPGASGLALADYSLHLHRRRPRTEEHLRFRDNGNLVLVNEGASMDATLVDLAAVSPLYADENWILDAREVAVTGGRRRWIAGGNSSMPSGIQFETGRALALMAEKALLVLRSGHAKVQSVRASDGRVAGIEIATPDGESQQLETDVAAWLSEQGRTVSLPAMPRGGGFPAALRRDRRHAGRGRTGGTADHPGEGLPSGGDPRVRGRLHMGIDPRARRRSPAGRRWRRTTPRPGTAMTTPRAMARTWCLSRWFWSEGRG